MNQEKKVCLVTGGTKGLGLSICRDLYAGGYEVVACSRKLTEQLQSLMDESEGRVHFRELDLADIDGLHDWSKQFITDFGVPYALINNAAVAHDGVLGTMHDSQIAQVISTNVTGTIILTKYISRTMLRKRSGRVINISSIIGSTGFNGLSVYAASKAAMNGFTKSLSRELGRVGITVNSVAPGYMKTDMSGGIDDKQFDQITRRSALRRLAETDEVATAVSYLLSESAGAITGTVMTIDAGNTA